MRTCALLSAPLGDPNKAGPANPSPIPVHAKWPAFTLAKSDYLVLVRPSLLLNSTHRVYDVLATTRNGDDATSVPVGS